MARNIPQTMVYRYLRNAAGENLVTKDYGSASASATGVFFYCASVPTDINRILITIEDTKGMEAEEYGNLGAELSTGYSMQVWNSANGSAILDINDGDPIIQNRDFGALMFDIEVSPWTNTTNEVAHARLTFSEAGHPIFLQEKQRFQITFVDNFTGLIDHRFQLQGRQQY